MEDKSNFKLNSRPLTSNYFCNTFNPSGSSYAYMFNPHTFSSVFEIRSFVSFDVAVAIASYAFHSQFIALIRSALLFIVSSFTKDDILYPRIINKLKCSVVNFIARRRKVGPGKFICSEKQSRGRKGQAVSWNARVCWPLNEQPWRYRLPPTEEAGDPPRSYSLTGITNSSWWDCNFVTRLDGIPRACRLPPPRRPTRSVTTSVVGARYFQICTDPYRHSCIETYAPHRHGDRGDIQQVMKK